jgi:hypothetical protein
VSYGATNMLFGKNNRRREQAVARPALTPVDKARGLLSTSNGPDTPVMDVAAMRKALNHAAWRDPWVERRKGNIIANAIRTLERTAACVDLAIERLAEAHDTLVQGKEARDQVMRELLTARFEELLDSLERVVILAQDGAINLLAGVTTGYTQTSGSQRSPAPSNGLSLDIGNAGFSYVLTPIDIRRGPTGLGIGVLINGFEDDGETYAVETALIKAKDKLRQFAERLSQDATMMVRIARDYEAANPPSDEEDGQHQPTSNRQEVASDQQSVSQSA